MRRSLRDNESIPIPLEWNIMKFVAQIDKRRRKQFGFADPPGQTTSRGRGRKKVIFAEGFSKISQFLERILMKNVDVKNSSDSKLLFMSICSIRTRSGK